MKHLLLFFIALMVFVAAYGQTYIGELTTNGYTYKNAKMELIEKGTTITLTMRHVKFAKLMPVKVDVEVKGLTANRRQRAVLLNGNNIIPLSNGKPHANRTIHDFKGIADATTLTFECKMGDKRVSFSGQATSGNGNPN